jgi:rod shape-determining protein MreC
MNLNSANADLLKRVADLETELYAVKRTFELSSDSVQTGRMMLDSATVFTYQFLPARVVNNTVSLDDNYLTIDKGYEDGIEEDMGVISENGIVGVIMKTSPRFSIVISVLNSKFRLSCKVRYNNYIGPLVWDGKDSRYTYLTELPRHVDFAAGDTIVTSGYSAVFPEGLPVGSIVSFQKQRDDNYTSLKIRLFTNFNTLRNVLIVKNKYQKEQRKLQETLNQ